MYIGGPSDISLATKCSALFKTGAIFIPSVTLIGLATVEIFETIGLSSYKTCQSLAYLFTVMSSIALTSAIAVRLGWTVPTSTEMMRLRKIYRTAWVFLPALCSFAMAVQLTTDAPFIRQLKVGSLLLPLALLIGTATQRAFESMHWQASKNRFITTCVITLMIATTLTAAIGTQCQRTVSFPNGLKVCLGISCYLIGIFATKFVLENTALGTNHQIPGCDNYIVFNSHSY